MYVETVVNGVADVLAGSLGGFASAVEKALVMLIAPVISFIADYLGFGDLPGKIANQVGKFQGWILGLIEQALVWLIEKGKSLLAVVAQFSLPKEGHTVTAIAHGDFVQVRIASDRESEILAMLSQARTEVVADVSRSAETRERITADLDSAREMVRSMLNDWKATADQKQDFRSWSEVRLTQIANILGHLGADGIQAFRDFKGRPLDKRYLPPGYDVRAKLYIRGSSWSRTRAQVAAEGALDVASRVGQIIKNRTANRPAAETAWDQLVKRLCVPDGATIENITLDHVRRTEYEVDHIDSLAEHWESQGGNDGNDQGRWTLSECENLRYITKRDNAARTKGRYVPWVGKAFTSVYAQGGGEIAKEIDGESFRDAPPPTGQPI